MVLHIIFRYIVIFRQKKKKLWGFMGGGERNQEMSNKSGTTMVSVQDSVKKIIQKIKEITGFHSEDVIYAMLKDCSMDPNETPQKLLFQDTFHEVKRKRDKRRENLNKESAEPMWKPAMQGRGNNGRRGNFSSHHTSLDASVRRNSIREKENGSSEVVNKGIIPYSVPTVEAKNTSSVGSNGARDVGFGSNSSILGAHASAGKGIKQTKATSGADSVKLAGPLHASDPVRSPSHDSRSLGAVGTIRRKHVPTKSNESKTMSAGPVKESKPKPTNNNISTVSAEVDAAKEGTFEAQQRLKTAQISGSPHVIFPSHLYVPEAEKLGFCFGSFEASLGLGIHANKSSETSVGVEEPNNEQSSGDQDQSPAAEHADCSDPPLPSSCGPESLSEDASSSVLEYDESKQGGGYQYSVAHTYPNYYFGFVPPQFIPFENSGLHNRDVSHFPNFAAQQPIDPTGYYAQFYRTSSGDGHISSSHSPEVSAYNGDVVEGGNPTALTALATQDAGVSAPIAQQPLPVFVPAGMHHMQPHYPPNYIPYAHYYSPYCVPPAAIHQFLSNGGIMYPPPVPSAGSRYSVSQYSPVDNVGSGSYEPYGSSAANYDHSPTKTAGNNPASNEENNIHVSKQQQSEGSNGPDLSGVQASSFYNLPGYGSFPCFYHHPAQSVTAQTVDPPMQESEMMGGPVDSLSAASTFTN